MPPLPRLQVQYPNRRALLANARTEGAVLSLFVPGSQHVAVGTQVAVDIAVNEATLRFELQGRVRMQVAARGNGQQPGLSLTFEGEQKRVAARMLAACAGRALESGTALDSRHAVNLRCLVNLRTATLQGGVKDVSITGAFIATPRVSGLRVDDELTIQVDPLFGRWGGSVLRARVIWLGEKRGVPGFGVRFLDVGAHVRESLKKHVPRLSK